jgi:hypothetical protein
MAFAAILSVFLFSTFKFMFAPFTGLALGLSYIETFLTCAIGGTVSAAFFYFSAGKLMKRAKQKRHDRYHQALESGIEWIEKNKFTRLNKMVVKMKMKLGIYGICFWAPFFLSVPVGSIIAAKFYSKYHHSFLLIVLGMFLNSFVMTSVAFLFN